MIEPIWVKGSCCVYFLPDHVLRMAGSIAFDPVRACRIPVKGAVSVIKRGNSLDKGEEVWVTYRSAEEVRDRLNTYKWLMMCEEWFEKRGVRL